MSTNDPTNPSTEIARQPQAPPALAFDDGSGDPMRSTAGLNHSWRTAQMFAKSALVPEHLRGRVEDVAIVLLMAWRLKEDPLTMMQNTHVVKGKAGFSAQYVIARANTSGVFIGRIKFRERGTIGSDDYAVTAYAVLAETGEEISFEASMKMAKDEGWTSNSKYKSMPHVMLRYRAATFLVRLNAPDVMLGRYTVEEIDDVDHAAETRGSGRHVITADPASFGVRPATTLPDPRQIEAPVDEPDSAPADEPRAEVVDLHPEPETPPVQAQARTRTRGAQQTLTPPADNGDGL